MTIKITGSMISPNTLRTMVTAYEKEVSDLEFKEYEWREGAPTQDEDLAIHPFGQMPVMVNGSFTLFEWRAIMRYLDAKFEGQGNEGTPLSRSTPEERALVDQWTEVGCHTLSDPLFKIIHNRSTKPNQLGLPADETVLEGALQKIGSVLDVYNAHLAKNKYKYLAGNFLSLADLSHLPMLEMLLKYPDMRHFVDDRPYVKVWWAEITGRRSWQKALKEWKSEVEVVEATQEAAKKKEEAS